MNNKKIGLGIVGILVLVGVFYGGMVYGKSQKPTSPFGQAFSGSTRGTRGAGGFGGLTTGQIISKDATSITVQLITSGASGTPSGSKIIFFDSNTKITKQAAGTVADLAVGTQVSVTGTPNTDGSLNATTVQIRPATPPVVK